MQFAQAGFQAHRVLSNSQIFALPSDLSHHGRPSDYKDCLQRKKPGSSPELVVGKRPSWPTPGSCTVSPFSTGVPQNAQDSKKDVVWGNRYPENVNNHSRCFIFLIHIKNKKSLRNRGSSSNSSSD